jgi:hypothetical protein
MKTEGNGNDSILPCRKVSLSPIKESDGIEVRGRHRASLDGDSGSSCAEVAKTVADLTFPGLVLSDDDRKSSHRNDSPDAVPIWTLSSHQMPTLPTSERQVDISLTLEHEEVTHSSQQDCNSSSRDHLFEPPSSRIIDLLPIFPRINSPRSSLSPSGFHRILEHRLASSKPGNDHASVRVGNVSKPKSIDAERATSSSRIALGSLPSRSRTSDEQGTSMKARRRRRDAVPQSSNLTGPRSDSADDFPIATSRRSGLPLSESSNLSDASLTRKDTKTQAVKHVPKSMPLSPPSYLISGFLDQTLVQLDEASPDEDDPPGASSSGKAQKGRRSNNYPISLRSRDISGPDCFLSGDSGEII